MKRVLILSSQPFSGKTFVSLGLIFRLKELGHDVGYFKPVGLTPQKINNGIHDTDAIMIKDLLSLKEPLELISPFVITYETINLLMEGKLKDIKARIKSSFEVLKQKEILIIGGAGNLFTGAIFGVDGLSLMEETDSKVLAVENFSGDSTIDNLIGLSRLAGSRFLGAVINKIPENTKRYVKENLKPFMELQGIKIFGLFERDTILESLTVRDIVAILNGKVLCAEERLDELVEHFTVGAMDVDSALKYFRRIPNKAVITGAHRSDIQLAAMETSTKVIILTGGTDPNDVVIAKAESRGIPLVSVEYDTFTTVDKIELMRGKVRIKEPEKIKRLKELSERDFDINSFMEALSR